MPRHSMMTCDEAMQFLRRKLELMVENTPSEANESKLLEYWEPRLASVDLAVAKLRDLQVIDRDMEKNFRRFIMREDQPDVRAQLEQEFGVSRLTSATLKLADPGSAAADEVAYTPSSGGPLLVPEADGPYRGMLRLSSATIGEVAQLYADYAAKTVRVPRALVGRAVRGLGCCAPSFVIESLEMSLRMEQISVLRKSGGIVVLRDVASGNAVHSSGPAPATPDEKSRAAAAMSVDRFWKIIERAAKEGDGEPFAIAQELEEALRRLNADQVLGFQLRFDECMAAAGRNDLWAVAYLMNGGCSDDGFEYFRCWLIAQGRDYFEAALRDPERAADRAGDDQRNECEAILYVGNQVYERKTGRPRPYGLADPVPRGSELAWREEDLPRLFPRLVARFQRMPPYLKSPGSDV